MSTTVNASKRHLEINATEFDGQLDGTIKTNTTATTQSAGDNSTKVATTAYADAVLPSWVPTSNPSYLTGINSSQVTNALGFTPYNATNPSNYITGYTVTQGDVTGHQAALSITESQISDLQSYLTAIPSGYATESYVQTQITNLVDSAPSTLNTLDELALALGDDPNFATTIATNIGTKLPKSGGTMSGNLLMGNSAITGVNYLEFNDPGPSEGLQWNGGNIKIYESPDNLTTNSAGNLQIVYGTTRRLTVNNSGIDVNGSVTATSLDINGAADISGDLTVNGTTQLGNALTDKAIVHGHLGIGHEAHPKIAYPGQNALWGEANNSTVGQVVIDLPGTLSNYDMTYMEIDIYEYNSTNATKLIIGGHNWNSGANSNTSSTMWHNAGVTVIGSNTKSVYLGWRNDGTNNRRVIAIGEIDSTWSYPTIHVAKVHGNDGYSTAIDWVGDWAMNVTTSGSFFSKSPTTNWNATTATTFKTTGKASILGEVEATSLDINGAADITGTLLLDSANYNEHLKIRRGVYGYDTVVTGTRIDYTPTSSTDTFKFLANLQTTGALTSTSLDVNGNADISGNLTVHDQIITTAPGSLFQVYKSTWSNATNHDVLYQSWNTYVDDFVYLKAPGNTTTGHGIALIGDNVIAFGKTNAETGNPELTSAAAPLQSNWLVLNSTNATFAGSVTTGGDIDLPSGSMIDWANGDARIQEGLVNNYSLSFQTYDGSAVTTALRLDGNNTATFAGTINATDGSAATPAYNFSSHDGNGMYLEEYDASNNKEQVSIATDGTRRLRINEAGVWTDQNLYFAGQLRKFGEWHATSGTAGQGFKFENTADSTIPLTLTSAGNATFAGDARFNQRVRIGDVTGLSNRGAVRIDTRGDAPADLLFGRDTAGTATSWNGVYWGLSSRGSSEGNVFKIYRGGGHSSPYNSEAVPFMINPDLSATFAGTVTANGTTLTGTQTSVSGSSGSCTGNAATATSASSAAKLTDGGGISTHPGTSNLIYTGALGSTVSGLFTASDNSNSILTVNRHVGDYNSQLGFSSNGNLYYRKFSNSTAYTTQVWKTLAFTDTDITGDTTGNAATATNVAYSGLTGTVPTWNQNTTGSSGSCTGNAASVTNGVYTTGNQTIAGNKTFSGQVTANNSIYLQDGEGIYITGQNYPHLTLSGDEPTLSSGQGDTCYLSDNVRVNGDLTVNGGDITLNGTGKITGIDTVTAATHAANKSYVDTQVATRAASSHTHTFASLTSKPTTISGYGITDALVIGTTPTTAKRGDTTTISVAQANAISANTTHAASSHAPSNATANSSDATLLARANHTGTQAYSTLTGVPTKATYDLDHLFDLVGAAADTSTNMGNYTSGSVPANQTIKQNIEALSTRKENFIVACSDETSDLTTGTAKVTFRIPYIMQITNVRASLTTACTTGVVTVDINLNGSSIFGNGETGTRLTIDSGERTSTTAATAYNFVSSATAVTFADDAEVSIDIDTVGTETPGKGLKVTLIGYHR